MRTGAPKSPNQPGYYRPVKITPAMAKVPEKVARQRPIPTSPRRKMSTLFGLSKKDLSNAVQGSDGLSKTAASTFSKDLDLLAEGGDLVHLQYVPLDGSQPQRVRHNYRVDLAYRTAVSSVTNIQGDRNWNGRFLEALAQEGLTLLPLDHTILDANGPTRAPWPAGMPGYGLSPENMTYITECVIIWQKDRSYISFLGS